MARAILVTGGSGYIGEMICEQLALDDSISTIVVIDKEPQSEVLKKIPKVAYVETNLADEDWESAIARYAPDTIIHVAWQIRALYGREKEQWRWNIEGSDRVFDFAFTTASVQHLIHFSTAAVYGAQKDNSLEHYFNESEARDDEYVYAYEKLQSEIHLKQKYQTKQVSGRVAPKVTILRLAAVTGPRGRFQKIRFGLQSALIGNVRGSVLYRMVTMLTAFMPATKSWIRQFVHEDDVVNLVLLLAQPVVTPEWQYQVLNVTPDSAPVTAKDMARAVDKRIIPVYPWMVRMVFASFWHLTRGAIPTCSGSWRFYSYPILMSGVALKDVYTCQYTSYDALVYTDGRYESLVPADAQKSKSDN